jgi:hypothetical protein
MEHFDHVRPPKPVFSKRLPRLTVYDQSAVWDVLPPLRTVYDFSTSSLDLVNLIKARHLTRAASKVKLSLCLLKQALRREDVTGSRGTAPPFLASAANGGESTTSRPI